MQSYFKVLTLTIIFMNFYLPTEGVRNTLNRYYQGGGVVWDSANVMPETDSSAGINWNSVINTEQEQDYNIDQDSFEELTGDELVANIKRTKPAYMGYYSKSRRNIQKGEKIRDGLIERGFSPMEAAAITGNIQAESAFDLNAVGDTHLKDHSYGLMQWRKDRLDRLTSMYGTDLESQLDYIAWEMLDPRSPEHKNFMTYVRGADNLADATKGFMDEIERPSQEAKITSGPIRYKYAQNYM